DLRRHRAVLEFVPDVPGEVFSPDLVSATAEQRIGEAPEAALELRPFFTLETAVNAYAAIVEDQGQIGPALPSFVVHRRERDVERGVGVRGSGGVVEGVPG